MSNASSDPDGAKARGLFGSGRRRPDEGPEAPEPQTVRTTAPGDDALRARVAELERKLQAAQQELQSRPRLQDLTPDELAEEAVGAAGGIVKAARVQAFELREAARTEAAATEERLRQAVTAADEDITRKRAQAQAEADALVAAAKENAARVAEQAQAQAQARLQQAEASATALEERSREQHDQLMAEAQSRLNATTTKSKAMIDAANETSAEILRSAREEASGVQAQARSALARLVEDAVGRLRDQQRTLDAMAATYASLRDRLSAVAEQVRETAEVTTLGLAKAENQAKATSADVEQRVAETMALLDRLTPGSTAPAAD